MHKKAFWTSLFLKHRGCLCRFEPTLHTPLLSLVLHLFCVCLSTCGDSWDCGSFIACYQGSRLADSAASAWSGVPGCVSEPHLLSLYYSHSQNKNSVEKRLQNMLKYYLKLRGDFINSIHKCIIISCFVVLVMQTYASFPFEWLLWLHWLCDYTTWP